MSSSSSSKQTSVLTMQPPPTNAATPRLLSPDKPDHQVQIIQPSGNIINDDSMELDNSQASTVDLPVGSLTSSACNTTITTNTQKIYNT